jgi:hypothetical protein
MNPPSSISERLATRAGRSGARCYRRQLASGRAADRGGEAMRGRISRWRSSRWRSSRWRFSRAGASLLVVALLAAGFAAGATVVGALSTTTTTIDTGAVAVVGDPIPLSAAVDCGGPVPMGSVEFFETGNPAPIGTVGVNGSGVASFNASAVITAYGDYVIHAKYDGDGTCDVSTSDDADLTVFPADPVQRYVDFVYELLLGRAAEAGGLGYWTGLINGGTDRQAISWAQVNSVEYRATVINNLYEEYLGRPADVTGRAFFLDESGRGISLLNVDLVLVSSDEYFGNSGASGANVDPFITAMYLDLLSRPPDGGGRSYLSGLLASGVPRVNVVAGVLYGSEHLSALVTGLYRGVLARDPDPEGLNYWVGQVQAGMPIQVLVALLVGSDELFSDITGQQAAGARAATSPPAGPSAAPYLHPVAR